MPRIKQQRDFFFSYNRVIDVFAPRMSPSAMVVYFALCRVAGDDEACYPGHERLGAMVGLKRRQVVTVVKALWQVGLLDIKRRHRGNGSRSTNLYYLPEPPESYPEKLREIGHYPGGSDAKPGGEGASLCAENCTAPVQKIAQPEEYSYDLEEILPSEESSLRDTDAEREPSRSATKAGGNGVRTVAQDLRPEPPVYHRPARGLRPLEEFPSRDEVSAGTTGGASEPDVTLAPPPEAEEAGGHKVTPHPTDQMTPSGPTAWFAAAKAAGRVRRTALMARDQGQLQQAMKTYGFAPLYDMALRYLSATDGFPRKCNWGVAGFLGTIDSYAAPPAGDVHAARETPEPKPRRTDWPDHWGYKGLWPNRGGKPDPVIPDGYPEDWVPRPQPDQVPPDGVLPVLPARNLGDISPSEQSWRMRAYNAEAWPLIYKKGYDDMVKAGKR